MQHSLDVSVLCGSDEICVGNAEFVEEGSEFLADFVAVLLGLFSSSLGCIPDLKIGMIFS